MKLFSIMVRILASCMLATFAGLTFAQQAYPSKPIRLIVPFAPGGSIDPVARLLGQKLSESWAQQVIVDNRPGANGVIGTDALAKSPPDGYTLILLGAGTHVINSLLVRALPYDSVKDFSPVATVEKSEYVLVVHPSVPANNFQEFIALAKAKPGQISYASSGNGNMNHLAAELFNMMTGVKTLHVPYKGGGQALTDLISGQVQMHFSVPISAISFIKSGKLKAIAIGGETRFATLPQVPTFTEAGLPGFNLRPWQGVLAPARTPRAVIDKLSAEIARIVAMPDTTETLAKLGMEPLIATPEQFTALMQADLAKSAEVIKSANIKLD